MTHFRSHFQWICLPTSKRSLHIAVALMTLLFVGDSVRGWHRRGERVFQLQLLAAEVPCGGGHRVMTTTTAQPEGHTGMHAQGLRLPDDGAWEPRTLSFGAGRLSLWAPVVDAKTQAVREQPASWASVIPVMPFRHLDIAGLVTRDHSQSCQFVSHRTPRPVAPGK
jgi:hypothetical protein